MTTERKPMTPEETREHFSLRMIALAIKKRKLLEEAAEAERELAELDKKERDGARR